MIQKCHLPRYIKELYSFDVVASGKGDVFDVLFLHQINSWQKWLGHWWHILSNGSGIVVLLVLCKKWLSFTLDWYRNTVEVQYVFGIYEKLAQSYHHLISFQALLHFVKGGIYKPLKKLLKTFTFSLCLAAAAVALISPNHFPLNLHTSSVSKYLDFVKYTERSGHGDMIVPPS